MVAPNLRLFPHTPARPTHSHLIYSHCPGVSGVLVGCPVSQYLPDPCSSPTPPHLNSLSLCPHPHPHPQLPHPRPHPHCDIYPGLLLFPASACAHLAGRQNKDRDKPHCPVATPSIPQRDYHACLFLNGTDMGWMETDGLPETMPLVDWTPSQADRLPSQLVPYLLRCHCYYCPCTYPDRNRTLSDPIYLPMPDSVALPLPQCHLPHPV